MKMIDIALYIPSLRGGGAERVMVILANGLADRGYKVDLVVAQAAGPYRSEVSAAVRIIDLGAKRVSTSLPGLIRYLRRSSPRAMLSAVSHANVIAVIAKIIARSNVRLIVSEHNNLSQSRTSINSIAGRVVIALMSWAYRKANGVVAVSNGVADDLAKTLPFPRSSIDVVYNPVVTPGLLERAAEPLSHPWLAAGEPPVILGVGRLTHQKDFSTLIRAFAVVRRNIQCRLVILGEGELRERLQMLAKELDVESDTLLRGFESNPFAWMKNSSLFVLSSAWEGLPTVLIEALACGAKVVSTDCPSGPSEILENGKWGSIVPVGNVVRLAGAIEEALRRGGDGGGCERAAFFGVGNAVSGYSAIMRV